jgi:hypothetical protein
LRSAVAKLAENFDAQVFSALAVSGHTIKHLLAGFSSFWVYRWRNNSVKAEAAQLFP